VPYWSIVSRSGISVFCMFQFCVSCVFGLQIGPFTKRVNEIIWSLLPKSLLTGFVRLCYIICGCKFLGFSAVV